MKAIFSVLVTILVSASAFASPKETADVARLLVNNPDIVNQLNANGTDALTKVEVTEVRQGVSQYSLVFMRSCHCVPVTATVSVEEDITPTFSDGRAKYTSSISVKTGFDQ